jgi:acylphosphatase
MPRDHLLRLDATVIGHVQGVSFRYYTQRQAQQLNLVGWVGNQPDGTVRVVAEGTAEALDALAEFLRTGPPHAAVDRVLAGREPGTGEFSSFRIRGL